ncbi:hypothetical protein RESH_05646 [Rhodopirellula europaea SH398]|uniref:Uncharacterized protein n=1 Tax=Rhodopirellula europaea SH398 TaxID=1263868 RepID=M5RWY7_9BACT|nr:hypothetical protein RESH_05646 [Rhodopirellula europaea SH398]
MARKVISRQEKAAEAEAAEKLAAEAKRKKSVQPENQEGGRRCSLASLLGCL